MQLNADYRVLNLYKTRQLDKCLKLCDTVLRDRSDRMVEYIRMRAMTIQAKIAGNGYEEVNYFPQNNELVSTAVAKTPRPGTSFPKITKTALNIDDGVHSRATAKTSVVNNTARIRTSRTALHTASRAARAATALAGGTTFTLDAPVTLRLLKKDDKLFTPVAKTLFEYIYYCEGNVRKAMEVAFQAKKEDAIDWWWNFSLARCYETLGMYRNVEECLRQALKMNKHISIYLRLIAMYVGLNQPLSAIEICKQGLLIFHDYTPLLLEQARVHEQLGNIVVAVNYYRLVATQDPTNMEAIANIATYNFYNDQPEIALRYYRRLLAMCPPGPEIYNNMGLCCLYCNQWDLILPCFRQSLCFATSAESRSNIWFNLAHVALVNILTLLTSDQTIIATSRAILKQLDPTHCGHKKNITIPDCLKFEITTNACRGYCESWSLPSIMLGFKRHPVTSLGQCCNIMESEDIPVKVLCLDGERNLIFKSAVSCACYHCQKE